MARMVRNKANKARMWPMGCVSGYPRLIWMLKELPAPASTALAS